MPFDRFFIDTSFELEKRYILSDDQLHHMNVMRLKKEDEIEFINGRNELASGKILSISKKEAVVQIQSIYQESRKLFNLILVQGFPKQNNLELILEKGTELGVTTFCLLSTDYSETPHLSPNKEKRVQNILISAIKQCGRLDLPQIQIIPSLEEFIGFKGSLFFGDVRKQAPYLLQSLQKIQSFDEPIVIFVGPEKGFSEKEELFLENEIQAKGVSLHPNILRTETAAISAMALTSHYLAMSYPSAP